MGGSQLRDTAGNSEDICNEVGMVMRTQAEQYEIDYGYHITAALHNAELAHIRDRNARTKQQRSLDAFYSTQDYGGVKCA